MDEAGLRQEGARQKGAATRGRISLTLKLTLTLTLTLTLNLTPRNDPATFWQTPKCRPNLRNDLATFWQTPKCRAPFCPAPKCPDPGREEPRRAPEQADEENPEGECALKCQKVKIQEPGGEICWLHSISQRPHSRPRKDTGHHGNGIPYERQRVATVLWHGELLGEVRTRPCNTDGTITSTYTQGFSLGMDARSQHGI